LFRNLRTFWVWPWGNWGFSREVTEWKRLIINVFYNVRIKRLRNRRTGDEESKDISIQFLHNWILESLYPNIYHVCTYICRIVYMYVCICVLGCPLLAYIGLLQTSHLLCFFLNHLSSKYYSHRSNFVADFDTDSLHNSLIRFSHRCTIFYK